MQMQSEWLYAEVGKLVRQARKRKGLTQLGLAQALDVSRTSVTNVELGRQHVQLHTLYLIADTLGVDPRDLLPTLGGHGSEAPTEVVVPSDLTEEEQEWIQNVVSSSGE